MLRTIPLLALAFGLVACPQLDDDDRAIDMPTEQHTEPADPMQPPPQDPQPDPGMEAEDPEAMEAPPAEPREETAPADPY